MLTLIVFHQSGGYIGDIHQFGRVPNLEGDRDQNETQLQFGCKMVGKNSKSGTSRLLCTRKGSKRDLICHTGILNTEYTRICGLVQVQWYIVLGVLPVAFDVCKENDVPVI